jgi:mercuric ion binding protein
MKKTKKMILCLMITFSSFAFAGEKIEVTVKGMVCSFCSQGITKKFKEQPEIKSISVDLEKHLVVLEQNENHKIDDAKVEKLLKDAGYSVEKITRK